jgi:endonuclease/exonuclease/phosphatase family metal-dependent hydrolase
MNRQALRIMTYNVHSCRGSDGVTSSARIAEVIRRWSPDVVALQEVVRRRNGPGDQLAAIAAETAMDAHFTKTRPEGEDDFGIATLVRHSYVVHREAPLPVFRGEPRAAHWLRVNTGHATLDIVNTHLSIHLRERLRQVQALLRGEQPETKEEAAAELLFSLMPISSRLVLCGDFNAGFLSAEYRFLCARLQNAQRAVRFWPQPTFPARYPFLRLDHIWLGAAWRVVEAQVSASRLERRASDHLPLIVDIEPLGIAVPVEEPGSALVLGPEAERAAC